MMSPSVVITVCEQPGQVMAPVPAIETPPEALNPALPTPLIGKLVPFDKLIEEGVPPGPPEYRRVCEDGIVVPLTLVVLDKAAGIIAAVKADSSAVPDALTLST